jgi:hypothetical protein
MKLTSMLSAVVVFVALGPLAAAPVPVRFAEGATHGFLGLRAIDGTTLAQGELLQVRRDGAVNKQMIFRFKDGSVFDEKVTFTEHGVFALKTYSLLQTGPSFAADTEISMTPATGAYRVKIKDHKGGAEKVLEGRIDLPSDVYNGMILTVTKDLAKGTGEVVHFVAFTPEPKLIELEVTPVGEDKIIVGELTRSAVHYVMKPRLGMWLRLFATLLRRVPDDFHVWILTDDVPAFVAFLGSLTTPGPVWRIELLNLRRPE